MVLQKNRWSDLGYSLLELLLIIAVSSLVLGMSVPSLHIVSAKHRLKAEARMLAAAIEQYNGYASKFETDVILFLNRGRFEFFSKIHPDRPLESHKIPAEIYLDISGERLLTLRSNGTTQPISLTLRSGQAQCAIIVSLYTRVRITC